MICYLFQHSRAGVKSRLWSGRIRLDDWPKARTFPLHVTDKRVADKKLKELLNDLERDTHGVGISTAARDALRQPITEHLRAFVTDCEAAKLSRNSLNKYRHALPKLCQRCGWTSIREITPQAFIAWRSRSGLKPKSVNDMLCAMRTFLNWMKRQRLILANPLADVPKVMNPGVGEFRRALSVDEIERLLRVAPPYRATVYQVILYTGLRRNEVHNLKWGDFDFAANPPRLRVPSSISKNRKESVHMLRPELVETLTACRPADSKPGDWAFRGRVPKIPAFKRDLALAGIPFEDTRGRRIDLHALRKTFGTLLLANGVAPRAAMELMRHSDIKLTMGVYTDVAQLPLVEAAARLPSFRISLRVGAETGTQISTHGRTQTGVVLGQNGSEAVATGRCGELSQVALSDVSSHEKAPQVTPRRLSEMERAKRPTAINRRGSRP